MFNAPRGGIATYIVRYAWVSPGAPPQPAWGRVFVFSGGRYPDRPTTL
jgi:hypothetical protein